MCILSGRPSIMNGCSGGSRLRRSAGLSLIEMLVALVVLSFSMAALYQAATGATRNVRVAAEYTRAVMIAESLLAEHSYLTQESFSSQGSLPPYRYQIAASPVPHSSMESSETNLSEEDTRVPLHYLKAVVWWESGRGERELDLTTVVVLRSKKNEL